VDKFMLSYTRGGTTCNEFSLEPTMCFPWRRTLYRYN